MAPELQADEMIFLVVARLFVCVGVFLDLLLLQLVGVAGRRPNRLCPPRYANGLIDVVLRYVGIGNAGGSRLVRQVAGECRSGKQSECNEQPAISDHKSSRNDGFTQSVAPERS